MRDQATMWKKDTDKYNELEERHQKEMKDELTGLQQTAGKDIIANFSSKDLETLEHLLEKLLSNIEGKIVPTIKTKQ